MSLLTFVRGSYTEKDKREQESTLIPVQTWRLTRKRTSNAGVLSDRIALKKTLNLCHGCIYKMGRFFPKNVNYCEITAFHCSGHCDGCRLETNLTIFVWEGSKTWDAISTQYRNKEIEQRERQVARRRY